LFVGADPTGDIVCAKGEERGSKGAEGMEGVEEHLSSGLV
jgi:hypothetical protein